MLKNSYEDVYGTGLHFRFGGGYMLDEVSEVRVTFTFQSLDADLTPLGDIGTSRLYGQYADYQSFGMDVGYRRYADLASKVRAYGEGTIGLAFIDETDVVLVAPSATWRATPRISTTRRRRSRSAVNAGVLVQVAEKSASMDRLVFGM